MKFVLKSRKFNREITFSRPGRGYLYVDLNKQEGTLGNQMCEGGYTMGECMAYTGESPVVFESICRNWWKNYLTNNPSL